MNKYLTESFEEVCQRLVFDEFGVLIDLEKFSRFNNTREALDYYEQVFKYRKDDKYEN